MISNAKDFTLGQMTPQLPNVSSTIEPWFQNLVVGVVTKRIVNFRTEESVIKINTRGMVQPLQPEQLEIKPEGQRAWPWFMIHCQPSLSLSVDDTIEITGSRYDGRYRVMSKGPYDAYGYIQYDIVKDYETLMTPA